MYVLLEGGTRINQPVQSHQRENYHILIFADLNFLLTSFYCKYKFKSRFNIVFSIFPSNVTDHCK